MHAHRLTIGILVAAGVLGCKDTATSHPMAPISPRAEEQVTTSAAPPIWARQVYGVTESGALYGLFLPARNDWKGRRLVLFIHGLVDPALPLSLPVNEGFDTLGAHGYAVALSSFSENGWAIKDGAQRTHELSELFAASFGAPSRTYLYGQSMGGLIALKLAESFPRQYDGVLAECGTLGGSYARLHYMFDVRSLFDYFYPGVLPGGTLGVPVGLTLMTAIRLPARAAMRAHPAGALAIAKIGQTPVPFKPDAQNAQLIAAVEDQLVRHAREVNDVIARGHGEPPVGNRDVRYVGALDQAVLDDINRKLPRYDAGRFAAHYFAQYYEPSGDLHVPVLALYTQHDPVLPVSLSHVLYQSRIPTRQQRYFVPELSPVEFGHCTTRLADKLIAFQKMVTWVEGRPAP